MGFAKKATHGNRHDLKGKATLEKRTSSEADVLAADQQASAFRGFGKDADISPYREGRIMLNTHQAIAARHRIETLLEEKWSSC